MRSIFDAIVPAVQWFKYQPELISQDEEHELLSRVVTLPFDTVVFRGIAAKRRVVQFGWDYEFGSRTATPADPMPSFLIPLRARAAAFAGVASERLEEVLVTEYQPGAGIGWHRDAPPFGVVVGVSLLSSCKLRLKPMGVRQGQMVIMVLEPRSAYLLSGKVRTSWQHSIPPTKELRYSVTFRTMRKQPEKPRKTE